MQSARFASRTLRSEPVAKPRPEIFPCDRSGGGGGPFDAGADQILGADFQTGSGGVVITEVTAPEPASLELLGAGLVGLVVVRRPRRRPETLNDPAQQIGPRSGRG